MVEPDELKILIDKDPARKNPFPHSTVLPLLQFSLAGIIGKPDTFFNVPANRFAFEFLQFM